MPSCHFRVDTLPSARHGRASSAVAAGGVRRRHLSAGAPAGEPCDAAEAPSVCVAPEILEKAAF